MKKSWRFVGFLPLVVALAATSAAAGTFIRIDMPGVAGTAPFGINAAGDIVGAHLETPTSSFQGFLYSGGLFTTINVPGGGATIPFGINDLGQIVGRYCTTGPNCFGFLFDGKTYTKLQYPGAISTTAFGINNAGQIVGYAGVNVIHAFLYSNGVFTDINPPETDFDGAYAYGINNLGDIVGCYPSKGLFNYYGWELTQGMYVKIILPDSKNSCTLGISDSGAMVGEDDKGVFIRNKSALMHQELRVPGAIFTQAGGINSLGQVVGNYFARQGPFTPNHGFLWTP
jgi:probable HAF family extracellular repeat protein